MSTPITLDELNQVDLASVTDEQISEIATRIESVEDKTQLHELIYVLVDGFYLLSEGSNQEENMIKTNSNIQKILSSAKLKQELDILNAAPANE